VVRDNNFSVQNGQLIRHVSHIELSAIIIMSHMLFHFIMEIAINIDLFQAFFVRDDTECDCRDCCIQNIQYLRKLWTVYWSSENNKFYQGPPSFAK
jgi:hypothetical protein